METFDRDIRILKRRIARHQDYSDLYAFYGSSTLRLWTSMSDDLNPLNVINLGFGGSHFDACIHHYEEVFKNLFPSNIVLYGGDNDLSQGYNAHEIHERFLKLCAMFRDQNPDVRIFSITVKPSPHRENSKSIIKEVNQMIKTSLEALGNAFQVNTYDALLTRDQQTRPELYMEDGLHLNQKGYDHWSTAVKNALHLHK
ncbi:MAG: GDSL-type esterase/lipase family protein [Cyclobacteriaceae bacterium]